MTRTRMLVTMIVALAASPIAAHEKGGHAVGVVEDVSAERLVIETADGHRVAFAVTASTRFSRGGTPARREDVEPGDRAAVQGEKVGEILRALSVKLGAARARTPAPRAK